jgi:signal transduction histidine kinase
MQDNFIKTLASFPVIVKILILGSVYWLFCRLGTLTFYLDFGIAIYWPATGIAVLGIYFLGRSAAPGIFISALFINYFVYYKGFNSLSGLIISITAIACANTLGALLGSMCLKIRVFKKNRSLFRLDSFLTFVLFVVLVPSVLTSLTSGIVAYHYGLMPNFFDKTHGSFLADLIGILILVPLVFSWIESPKIQINHSKIFEFVLIVILLIISGYFIFSDFFSNYLYNFLIAYFTIPIYIWLALRFDSKTITTIGILSLSFISLLAIYSENNYLGISVESPYVLIQGFTILISMLIFIVHSVFMERQQSIESLQKGEERYHSLFENMPVSLLENDYSEMKRTIDLWPKNLRDDLLNTLTNSNEIYRQLTAKIKIVDANHTAIKLFGEHEKKKILNYAPEIFEIDESNAFCSVFTSFYEGKSLLEERILEVKIKKKKYSLSVRWSIMPGHEKSLSRVLVTILDISYLKKAEKETRLLNQQLEKKVLSRTDELNRTNQELEAFAYSVSHDLKAPLRAVKGFSSLLLDEFGNNLPQGAIHYIQNVQKNSENMTQLITDLLKFSRLGSKSLSYSVIDTSKLVKSIWQDYSEIQNPREIEFVVNTLPVVYADANLLTQVFVNLISNSVKYSKKGESGRIEISCKSDLEFYEFCINDIGIGFDQKNALKIFKVFQRLHSNLEYEGSGVGLALAQRIIHRHSGTIWASSEKGSGTSIFFTLPVKIDGDNFFGGDLL